MELKKVFEERRSVNFFDPNKKIDDAVLKNIVNLAVLAPSAFNLQPWEIIAVKTDVAKERLLKVSNNQPKILEAPVTLIVVGHKNGFLPENPEWDVLLKVLGGNKETVTNYQNFAGFLYGSSEERKIKFAESNASLLAMSLMYAAKEYGVESHPLSGVDFDGISKEFGLDENKSVVMLISLGYFDETKQLYPRRDRRGYDEIVTEV